MAKRRAEPPTGPRSMTGIGTHAVDAATGRFEAEARAVNHRFLKVSVRLPPGFDSLEPLVEERVRAKAERGHVTIGVRHEPSAKAAASRLAVDEEVAAAAVKRLRALAKRLGLKRGITLRDLFQVPGGAVGRARPRRLRRRREAATAAVDGALDALAASRAREGAHLAVACSALLDRIAAATEAIAARAPEGPQAYRDRLATRLAALLEGTAAPVDPAHLAREVAGFADRADVTEEVARLRAHVAHAREILAGSSVGRRLDFLVQEMNREANTAGSKSADATLSSVVIELKADVERLREQVQNFE